MKEKICVNVLLISYDFVNDLYNLDFSNLMMLLLLLLLILLMFVEKYFHFLLYDLS